MFCALGIRGTGRTMSRRFAAHFGSMAAIRAADVETLAGVDGIGTEKARVIVAELAEVAPVLDKLAALGVGTAGTAPAAAAAPGEHEGGRGSRGQRTTSKTFFCTPLA
ncbi:helix-hairpin-helix domain-containing protein [Kitasatospora sp. NPDC052896]|uniref:helix-hairpin-helix domain-containing protein n=1 Tax=Kitasatospora sp. NPDC052896 TaxID=3364061 RepID=UPI0037C7904D